jgi:hypothetical protein
MLSGKAQAATKPTAMGSLLQAATYGQTIPIIYGLTQSPLLAIWAANLRQGGSTKKFKQLKKGVTAYEENIDFLLGHNPILGVMQMWNNGSPIPLAFVTSSSLIITDPHFYAVVAVTAAQSYSVTFDDYGGGGSVTFTGTYQVPLWNELFNGPDPVHNSGYRNWPYVYRWQPGFGGTVQVAADIFTGFTVYYAQLMAATSYLPPLQKMKLNFEPELGDGDEYALAGNIPGGSVPYTTQQVIYPMFAGCGSFNMDLGSGGVIPQVQAEIQGKFGLHPSGDADFADMIEDIFKSGAAQAAIGATDTGAVGYTQVEHGLSAYQFPGCVQMRVITSVEAYTATPSPYNMPVTKGNFLIVYANTTGVGGGTVSISDSASNTWTAVFASGYNQVWYAQANATGPLTVTIANLGYDWCITLIEVGGVDTFDSVTAVTGTSTAAITTTNAKTFPEYLLTFAIYPTGYVPVNPAIPQWNLLTPSNYYGGTPAAGFIAQERTVNVPGTYSITNPDTAHITQMCLFGFKCSNPPSYPAPVDDFIDLPSLDQVRLQCHANGLWGSLSMNSQQAASDWLKTLYQAADAAPVFMGFSLYSFPYSEVSAVGNGAIYHAPTASGPVANLSTENGDFLAQNNAPPITVKTSARVDQPNVLQMQCINRSSNYNPSVVEQPDAASISLFGVRKADPIINNAVQDVSIARQLLGIQVRQLAYGGDIYSFSLPARWVLLAPMDLVTVTDPLADINAIPVRLTSIAEQSDGSLECQAEPFVYGMYAPNALPADTPNPYIPNTGNLAGSINTPIFFEPTPRLINIQNQAQLWVVVSSPEADYGGAQAYISTDGGSSYNPIGDPLVGSAITGVSTADWPAHADPDTTDNLALDLTESLGVLLSYDAIARDNFQYPCYIAGGGSYSIPYELMTYNTATLTATYKYTLMATGTGNELRRGVYAAPAAAIGVDHASGSRWAFLNPTGQGILKLPLDGAWIGTVLYFKFVTFNNFGTALQTLTSATPYSYTPTGLPANSGPANGFLVNGV